MADFRSDAEYVKMTLEHLTPEPRDHHRPPGVPQGTLKEQASAGLPHLNRSMSVFRVPALQSMATALPCRLSLVLTNQHLTLQTRGRRDRELVCALPCLYELYFRVTRHQQE